MSHRPQTLNISRLAQQLPLTEGQSCIVAENSTAFFFFIRTSVERVEVQGLIRELCTATSTFNYLWLIRPFSLPCRRGGGATSRLILFACLCFFARRARYKMLDIILRPGRRWKIILFHKHVTHSGLTLIGVNLIDGV